MAPDKQRVEVELNIFSGRPNPRWELSAVEVEALTPRVAAATAAASEPRGSQPAPQLGYRGIAVINSASAPGIPDVVYAFGGVLTIVDGEATSYRQDAEGLEQWLLDQARERGFGDAIDQALRHQKGGAAR